jgi:hypothetical protein
MPRKPDQKTELLAALESRALDGRSREARAIDAAKQLMAREPGTFRRAVLEDLAAINVVITQELARYALRQGLIDEDGRLHSALRNDYLRYQAALRRTLESLTQCYSLRSPLRSQIPMSSPPTVSAGLSPAGGENGSAACADGGGTPAHPALALDPDTPVDLADLIRQMGMDAEAYNAANATGDEKGDDLPGDDADAAGNDDDPEPEGDNPA